MTTAHTVKSKLKILQNFVAFSEYMNFNCFYNIFAKKRNSQGHFKYIKNTRLYIEIVLLCYHFVFTPQKVHFYWIVINLPVCYIVIRASLNLDVFVAIICPLARTLKNWSFAIKGPLFHSTRDVLKFSASQIHLEIENLAKNLQRNV